MPEVLAMHMARSGARVDKKRGVEWFVAHGEDPETASLRKGKTPLR
jgi:hypothetical protein